MIGYEKPLAAGGKTRFVQYAPVGKGKVKSGWVELLFGPSPTGNTIDGWNKWGNTISEALMVLSFAPRTIVSNGTSSAVASATFDTWVKLAFTLRKVVTEDDDDVLWVRKNGSNGDIRVYMIPTRHASSTVVVQIDFNFRSLAKDCSMTCRPWPGVNE